MFYPTVHKTGLFINTTIEYTERLFINTIIELSLIIVTHKKMNERTTYPELLYT